MSWFTRQPSNTSNLSSVRIEMLKEKIWSCFWTSWPSAHIIVLWYEYRLYEQVLDLQQSITTTITRWKMPLSVHLHASLHKISLSWSSWSKTTHFLNCSFPCRPVYNISCEVAGEWNGDWRGRRRACCLESRMKMWTNCRNSLCCCASFTPLLSSVLIHLLSPSFPCVQVPQILSLSALIIKSPPPTLSALRSHTHSENTAHWCNSCCLGGVMGDYEWDRSMWWFTHTNVHAHMCNLIIDEGLLTSPLLLRDILQLMRTHKHRWLYRPP